MTPYERGKQDRELGKKYCPPYTRKEQMTEYERGYDDPDNTANPISETLHNDGG